MIGQAERLRALREEPQDRFCVFADCQPGSRVHIQHDAHGQPRPSTEPVTAQRRASNTGVIMVAGQKIALGRIHAGQVVTVHGEQRQQSCNSPWAADEARPSGARLVTA
jgi:hypothetical protein